jgi:GNAT superfamily N-acetyltransferase
LSFLSSKILSDTSELKIYHLDRLETCPAISSLLKNYSELMSNGFVWSNYIPFKNDNSIIWGEINKEVVGGICFSYETNVNRCWIEFSFTEERFRNKGIYKNLHYSLEDVCKDKGVKAIGSFVHIKNYARIKSCESVGMAPNFYRMIKLLK